MAHAADQPGTPNEWVFIALGCNVGACSTTFGAAIASLAREGAFIAHLRSPQYSTPAFEVLGPQPPYLNQVIGGHTNLSPHGLLDCMLAIERAFGRERPSFRAPRTLDLDLLAFGERQIKTEALVLPHPEARRRAFVLQPWADIAPDFMLQGSPVRAWLDHLPAAHRGGLKRVDETHSPED